MPKPEWGNYSMIATPQKLRTIKFKAHICINIVVTRFGYEVEIQDSLKALPTSAILIKKTLKNYSLTVITMIYGQINF